MSTETTTETTDTASAKDIAAATEYGTEYDEKRYEIARVLHEIIAPNTAWHFAPDTHQDACYADAHTALLALPHLLSDDERERLAPLLPALALTVEEAAT
jgi:hypothetical protein